MYIEKELFHEIFVELKETIFFLKKKIKHLKIEFWFVEL